MNVSSILTTDYENKSNWTLGENKPNSNPIKPKTNPIPKKSKMNVNIYYTIDYNNKTAFRRIKNKPNSNPNKPNQSMVYCGIHTGKDGTIRIALQVYISHTITNRTEFFTRKGQLL